MYLCRLLLLPAILSLMAVLYTAHIMLRERGESLGFIVTGRVERVRESTNQTTGEKSAYVEIADWGMLQEINATMEQVRGLTAGATVQVPVSVRASAFNGQARLTVRATEAFKVAQAQAQGSR